jgi:hypothetical protein
MLRAESCRVGRTFRKLEQRWQQKAQQRNEEARMGGRDHVLRGAAAFAERQSAMFGRLATTAEARYAEVLASGR